MNTLAIVEGDNLDYLEFWAHCFGAQCPPTTDFVFAPLDRDELVTLGAIALSFLAESGNFGTIEA